MQLTPSAQLLTDRGTLCAGIVLFIRHLYLFRNLRNWLFCVMRYFIFCFHYWPVTDQKQLLCRGFMEETLTNRRLHQQKETNAFKEHLPGASDELNFCYVDTCAMVQVSPHSLLPSNQAGLSSVNLLPLYLRQGRNLVVTSTRSSRGIPGHSQANHKV